jgi:hypothetical protein
VETDNITLFYNFSKRVWGKTSLTGMKGMKGIRPKHYWTLIDTEKNDLKAKKNLFLV